MMMRHNVHEKKDQRTRERRKKEGRRRNTKKMISWRPRKVKVRLTGKNVAVLINLHICIHSSFFLSFLAFPVASSPQVVMYHEEK